MEKYLNNKRFQLSLHILLDFGVTFLTQKKKLLSPWLSKENQSLTLKLPEVINM